LIRCGLGAGYPRRRPQNIDSQRLARKIFRNKELAAPLATCHLGLFVHEGFNVQSPPLSGDAKIGFRTSAVGSRFHSPLSEFSVKVVRHTNEIFFGKALWKS
jgi:hypothetical protein